MMVLQKATSLIIGFFTNDGASKSNTFNHSAFLPMMALQKAVSFIIGFFYQWWHYKKLCLSSLVFFTNDYTSQNLLYVSIIGFFFQW